MGQRNTCQGLVADNLLDSQYVESEVLLAKIEMCNIAVVADMIA